MACYMWVIYVQVGYLAIEKIKMVCSASICGFNPASSSSTVSKALPWNTKVLILRLENMSDMSENISHQNRIRYASQHVIVHILRRRLVQEHLQLSVRVPKSFFGLL